MKRESITRNLAEPSELSIPGPVLENMVRTGQIPTQEVKWADDRRWCKFALRGDAQGAANCPELRREPGGQWCGLNGKDRCSPCAFDEPESAQLWVDINAYQEEGRQKGWFK